MICIQPEVAVTVALLKIEEVTTAHMPSRYVPVAGAVNVSDAAIETTNSLIPNAAALDAPEEALKARGVDAPGSVTQRFAEMIVPVASCPLSNLAVIAPITRSPATSDALAGVPKNASAAFVGN